MGVRIKYVLFSLACSLSAGIFSNNDSLARAAQKREIAGRISVLKINLNSDRSDYSPQLVNGQLYFISDRVRQAGVQYTDEKGSSEISDLYVSRMRDSTHFSKPALIKELSSKYHEGPFCLSTDGEKMFLTGNFHNALNKIFYAEKKNGKWTKPVLLPFCDDEHSYCHPSFSEDGTMLFFSSDRGGQGGMDLFYSYYSENKWSEPVNAGPKINSSSNELFPFLAPKNKLFFASNRQGSFGGLDIYSVTFGDSLEVPERLPSPVNSASDDFGIWVDSTLQRGYFSSNRLPRSNDDIFYFSAVIPDFTAAKTPTAKSTFCYNFFEETTLGNNDTSNLEFEWDCGDGNKKRGLRARHCYSSPGTYKVKLNIVEKLSGEIFNSLVEYELNILTPEKLYISCDDSVRAGDTLQVNCFNSALKGYEIREKFWSLGDGYFNSGDILRHVYSQPGEYDLELWVNAINLVTKKKEKFKIRKKIHVTGNINAE